MNSNILCNFVAVKTKNAKIMTTLIGIAAIVALALVGWCIAEAKGKAFCYHNNEEEQAVLAQQRKQLEQNGFTELNISDVIKLIATTGYKAV